MEGEEVDRVVSPPMLKRVREEEQRDSSLLVTGSEGHAEGRVKGTGPAVNPLRVQGVRRGEAGRKVRVGTQRFIQERG